MVMSVMSLMMGYVLNEKMAQCSLYIALSFNWAGC